MNAPYRLYRKRNGWPMPKRAIRRYPLSLTDVLMFNRIKRAYARPHGVVRGGI
jgi:hypothetical protein